MSGLLTSEHDIRDLAYRRRVVIVAEIVDRETGEVVATGEERDMKQLYRSLKKGILADPEVRARMSAASKKAWAELRRLAELGRRLSAPSLRLLLARRRGAGFGSGASS